MTTAVTPGRALPPSIAKAIEGGASPSLIPRDQLISALAAHNYTLHSSRSAAVADAKRLLALLFTTN